MGEVRVVATLTNASDEERVRQGLCCRPSRFEAVKLLEKLDLFVDGQGRRLVPNPAHPDQAITKVK